MGAPAHRTENAISDGVLEKIREGAFESWEARRLLGWAIETFHPRLALSASFGAPEGMVLLDMMHRLEPASRVFVLDTGRLPQATHDLIDRVRERYGKPVEVLFPRPEAVEEMVRRHGMNLFYESVAKRQLCCRIRKVEPLERKLAELDAWVSGLRRAQNVTRTDTPKVEIDHAHGGIVKVNPLADWSAGQVADYVRAHDVPTNRLHRLGYPSVGCDPWERPETRECGIHVGEEEEGSGI